jgi:hypothetical protein
MCRLKFNPNLMRSWLILLFWPTCSCSSVRIQFLSHSDFKSVSSFWLKLTLPRCFFIAIILVRLHQVCRMRMHLKAEKVIHNDIIGSFLRLHWFWGQKPKLLGRPNSVQTEFQQPGWLKKVITSKPLIVSRHINNCWKEEVFYNSCVGPIVRLLSEQSQIYIFWL